MAHHEILKFQLHRAFGHSRLHVLNDMGERRIGNCLRVAHTGNFTRIFHGTQAGDEPLRFHQIRFSCAWVSSCSNRRNSPSAMVSSMPSDRTDAGASAIRSVTHFAWLSRASST